VLFEVVVEQVEELAGVLAAVDGGQDDLEFGEGQFLADPGQHAFVDDLLGAPPGERRRGFPRAELRRVDTPLAALRTELDVVRCSVRRTPRG
jgi:hypothetical protein